MLNEKVTGICIWKPLHPCFHGLPFTTTPTKWGPVYLSEMMQLQETAPEIYKEFNDGNFVIKRSSSKFNQVSPDHATEWMNRLCKLHNGIIGITRNDLARDKFCLTWAERSRVTENVKLLLGGKDDTDNTKFVREDALPSRIQRDRSDVRKLVEKMQELNLFSETQQDTCGSRNLLLHLRPKT